MSDLNFQTAQAALAFCKQTAKDNVGNLKDNPYPGRGIILGIDETSKFVLQVYWLMGRSQNSKNRILKFDNSKASVHTDFFNYKEAGDPSLVIYDAMLEESYCIPEAVHVFAVSNGHQTKTLIKKDPMIQLQHDWSYEPDEPNFTPRISGLTILSENHVLKNQLAIIKKSNNSKKALFTFWSLKDTAGYGHCIHTYASDGVPLPSFKDEPYLVPLKGTLEEVANFYWDLLNPEFKVSLVVKMIPVNNISQVKICIINQNED